MLLLGLYDCYFIGLWLILIKKHFKFPVSSRLLFLYKKNICFGLHIHIQGLFPIKINRFWIFLIPIECAEYSLSFIIFSCHINTFIWVQAPVEKTGPQTLALAPENVFSLRLQSLEDWTWEISLVLTNTFSNYSSLIRIWKWPRINQISGLEVES